MEDVLGTQEVREMEGLPSVADLDADAADKVAAAVTNGKGPIENLSLSEEFRNEIIALRAEIEQLKSLVRSLGALVEEHDADLEGYDNRIAAFNARSTHKL